MESNNHASPWDEFLSQMQTEAESAKRSLKEVNLLLEQSQVELARLTTRNKNVAEHLQQIQGVFDTIPREEIKTTYKDMLDAQQRLLVMRGQLEKLQADQANHQKYITLLDNVQNILLDGPIKGKNGKASIPTLEMMINAQESERQRLSRQMHDGPAQALSNFIVQVEIAARLLDMDPVRAREELNALKTAAMSTFQKVRTFISDLRPMMLDDLGLAPTVKRYLDSFREQTGMDVNITVKGADKRFENYLEVFVFRAIQELIGNAYRLNQDNPGKVQISVLLVIEENLIKTTVSDNGKGFDPNQSSETDEIGFKLIKERVELLHGQFEIDSAPEKGSRIYFQVPFVEVVTS